MNLLKKFKNIYIYIYNHFNLMNTQMITSNKKKKVAK